MTSRLEGKVAVVTGAGSGIGRATAELFHQQGCRVVVADISGSQVDVAQGLGGGAVAVQCDVSSSTDVHQACAAAETTFGRLDVLFSNAGTGSAYRDTVDEEESTIDTMLSVNTKGAWLGIKHAAPIMKRSGGGSIINTASTAALFGYPGMSAYAASKAGIIGLTYAAARELGPDGIRVNTICPGPTDTALRRQVLEASGRPVHPAPESNPTALRRIGTPDEIAKAALFLASDDASFVTGVILPVDGGQRA